VLDQNFDDEELEDEMEDYDHTEGDPGQDGAI
jgi:hypothetical protein